VDAAGGPQSGEAAETTVLTKALEDQPPEKWLEAIEKLRQDGRASEAERLLAAFHKRFPDRPAVRKP
jgi:hypothetical protein